MAQTKIRKSEPGPEELGSDKRVAILNGALAQFAQYGYRRTSMEDIAQNAGIAKGTIYLYFKSKEELFAALAQQLLDEVERLVKNAMAEDSAPLDRLIGMLEAKFFWFYARILSSPHAQELVDEKSRVVADLYLGFDAWFRAQAERLLIDADKAGDIDLKKAGVTAPQAVEALIAAGHGAEGGEMGQRAFEARFGRIVRLVVAGLSAAPVSTGR